MLSASVSCCLEHGSRVHNVLISGFSFRFRLSRLRRFWPPSTESAPVDDTAGVFAGIPLSPWSSGHCLRSADSAVAADNGRNQRPGRRPAKKSSIKSSALVLARVLFESCVRRGSRPRQRASAPRRRRKTKEFSAAGGLKFTKA